MDSSAEYLRQQILRYAESGGWALIEEEVHEDDGEPYWEAGFRLPCPPPVAGTEEPAAPGAEAAPTEGPLVIATVQDDFLTISIPIELKPDFVRERVREVLACITSYGFALDAELPQESPGEFLFALSHRIYAPGFNSDVVDSVLDAVDPCVEELERLEAEQQSGGWSLRR